MVVVNDHRRDRNDRRGTSDLTGRRRRVSVRDGPASIGLDRDPASIERHLCVVDATAGLVTDIAGEDAVFAIRQLITGQSRQDGLCLLTSSLEAVTIQTDVVMMETAGVPCVEVVACHAMSRPS